MKEKGVKFITNVFPKQIDFKNKKFNVYFENNKIKKFDLVMEALGREPNVKSLNLNYAKVKTSENGSVIVDRYFKTSNKNIYAIGDVIDRVQLTQLLLPKLCISSTVCLKKQKKLLIIQIYQRQFSQTLTLHLLV